MSLQNFADVLDAARRQPEPQRLLLVFAAAELPRDATAQDKAAFERGEGGALAPKVCVDKRPEEIGSFERLVEESRETGVTWDILFVAALGGRGGFAPNPDEAVQPLRMMVEAIKGGRIADFLAVDKQGSLVQLAAT
ncbi:MAG: ribonucleotide reductase subunit alpha [Arenimonas sp.]